MNKLMLVDAMKPPTVPFVSNRKVVDLLGYALVLEKDSAQKEHIKIILQKALQTADIPSDLAQEVALKFAERYLPEALKEI